MDFAQLKRSEKNEIQNNSMTAEQKWNWKSHDMMNEKNSTLNAFIEFNSLLLVLFNSGPHTPYPETLCECLQCVLSGVSPTLLPASTCSNSIM